MKQMLVTERSFINGVLVPEGHIATVDETQLNGKETNLAELPDGYDRQAIVQIAAIAPTGPNPTAPQQIPPDATQTGFGTYAKPGATLVAEITKPLEIRAADLMDQDDDAEGAFTEHLAKVTAENAELKRQLAAAQGGDGSQPVATVNNDDDALVEGTVAEIAGTLGTKTDEQLEELRAAEVDREKPRATLLKAIKAEQETRAANQ